MYKTLDLKVRPSSVLCIEEEYAAYCFDEAIAHIIMRLNNGDKVTLCEERSIEVHYSRPSELYKKYS